MATSTRLSTSLVLLFLPLLFVSTSAHNKPGLPAKPSLSCDVKSVCLTTPFPDLCKRSTSLLSPYGATELPFVIRGMLGLSISAAKAASLQVKGSVGFGVGFTSATGLEKRTQVTVKLLEGAMKEVNHLRQPGSADYARRVLSIQTQVSKAVTSSNDCLKVLRGVPSGFGPIKATGSVEHTVKLNSNLLVFVNKLQATVSTKS